ncbi:MAG: SMC family ATPase [Anaerolineae bacterium]|nr:SMC family ATPase [Anaerolineae bacterium]
MIPLKLELLNFLAYREPETLDLTGLHLACLTGANGAGKSSLLDAITWALWGKARTRRDDDLIHGDEIEMRVRLTFELTGNHYRVSRYRSRKGRGISALDLEVEDGGDWRSISESTIRDTQERLTSLLRLDYDTFINSAFLVQGRADEFTQKTPGERKAILGEILGLDVWETYEERTKARLRQLDFERQQIDSELERIQEELVRENEYRNDLDEANASLEDLRQQVEEAAGHVQELEETRRRYETITLRRDDLQNRISRDLGDLDRLNAEAETIRGRLAEYEETLAQAENIEEGYRLLQEARQSEREFGERLREQSDLREQLNAFQQDIASARSGLEAEQRTLTRQRVEMDDRIVPVEGKRETLKEAQDIVAVLEARKVEQDQTGEQISRLRVLKAELDAASDNLRNELNHLDDQYAQIDGAEDADCPLCRQPLSEQHRADLLDRLVGERGEKEQELQDKEAQAADTGRQIDELLKDFNKAAAELRNLKPRQDQIVLLNEQISQIEGEQAELDQLDAHLEEIDQMLTTEDYAHEARAQLAGLEARLAEVGYDQEAHQQAQVAATENQPFEQYKADLDHVRKNFPDAEERLARLEEQVASIGERIGQDQGELGGLEAELEMLTQQIDELQPWEPQLNQLRDQERQAHYRVGAAEQKLNTLEQLRARREKLHEDRDQSAEEYGIYEELRVAFGKDGIPAMLIDAAIPEIEAEANDILARMTDGRMHIRFETQREKVTGGTKETLDIRISDELGTRDYDTFSGGEAFRVNFAIRLALSRLLARRAGAQLRTLILDEGFGTQDTQGRERLVQAINAIKDDFALILVITHIEELREAFPAHIEVTKTPDGSLIEIT